MFQKIGIASILVLLLAGCASTEETEPATPETDSAASAESDSQEPEEGEGGGVEVDGGLFEVEVTLPPDFLGELSEEEIAANAEESDFSDYTINPDGSVTYTMSRVAYEAALAEMKTGLDESIQETVNEYPNVIRSVTYDDDVTEFEVVVDRAAYEAEFGVGFIGFTFGLGGMFYQIFSGVPEAEQQVVIDYVDEQTGEVLDSQTFPFEE